MDYDQLDTFINVSSFKNFSKAADYLNVAQPTVTARIKNLEVELDCTLFNRNGRILTLTREGEIFLEYAIKVVTYINEAKEAVHLSKQPRIKVGFSPGFSTSIVLETLRVFESVSNISISIEEGEDSNKLAEKMRNGQLDIAFVRNPSLHNNELIAEHLFDDKLVLILNPQHPLVHNSEIDLGDLQGETLICYLRHTPLWKEIDNKIIGIKDLKRIEVANVETGKFMVKTGWGISIVPALSIDDSENTNFKIAEFKVIEKIPNRVTALYKKDSPNLQNIRSIIDSLLVELKKRTEYHPQKQLKSR